MLHEPFIHTLFTQAIFMVINLQISLRLCVFKTVATLFHRISRPFHGAFINLLYWNNLVDFSL